MPELPTSPSSHEDIATELAGHFERLHGEPPAVVVAAPGRVNLIGEHTDYNDGLCLPIALQLSSYAAIARRDDDRVTATSRQARETFEASLDRLGPGDVVGWPAYVAGVVWALQEAGFAMPGMDLLVHSTVPLGGGLSSSAALECSVALAACEAAGIGATASLREQLVDICTRAERDVAGAPTGGMDQTVSLFAEARHALLIDFDQGTRTQVPWAPEAAGYGLLVIDTRAPHQLRDGGYGARRQQCERAAAALAARHEGVTSLRRAADQGIDPSELDDPVLRRRARHVISEISRVRATVAALDRDDYVEVGRLFDASHDSLAGDFDVSCDELDVACAAAHAAGALGARMTGGGFGGSAIALAPIDRLAEVEAAVTGAFVSRGWAEPGVFGANASTGARRVNFAPAGS
jgi:galactokinase